MENLSKTSERVHYSEWRYNIMPHLFIYLETLVWIWSLCMFSFEGKSTHWLFSVKPTTWPQYAAFMLVFGFLCGTGGIAGHELLHRKATYDKFVGTWAYTKFFYTHFLDEHIKGHHKDIATPGDPATAPVNMSVYRFFFRSAIG